MTKLRVGSKAKVLRTDLNDPLPIIENESLDLIVSSLTLHYLKNWDTVMREFYRILKKQGNLVFSVHHPLMEFSEFKKENYFLTELIDDEWDTETGSVKV